MKGYFSFIILLLLFFGLFLIFNKIYTTSPQQTSILYASNKIQDLSYSIEQSAKNGAYVGSLIYLTTTPKNEIDLKELNKIASYSAIISVSLIQEQSDNNYAIFCSSSHSNENELESSMLSDKNLEIPSDSSLYSFPSCINTIKAEVLLANNTITNIKLKISNNKNKGIIGISYYDESYAISNVEFLKHRELLFKFDEHYSTPKNLTILIQKRLNSTIKFP